MIGLESSVIGVSYLLDTANTMDKIDPKENELNLSMGLYTVLFQTPINLVFHFDAFMCIKAQIIPFYSRFLFVELAHKCYFTFKQSKKKA